MFRVKFLSAIFDNIENLKRQFLCENYIRSDPTSNYEVKKDVEKKIDLTIINPYENLIEAIFIYLKKNNKKSDKEIICILAKLSRIESSINHLKNKFFDKDCIENLLNNLITYLVIFFLIKFIF